MHYAIRNEYPIETEEHVKTAMDYFDKFLTRFPPLERAVIAGNLEKRASALSMNIDSDWVTNYSRMFNKEASISPDFDRNIQLRKDACLKGKITVMIGGQKIDACTLLEKVATLPNEEVPGVAIVKALEAFDKQANLQARYDADIIDPVLTVYGSLINPEFDSVKIACNISNYQAIRISRDQKMMEKVATKFPADFVDEYRKNPIEKLESLNPAEQSLFEETVA